MKSLFKKLINLLIYLSVLVGASFASVTAGWMEVSIKLMLGNFSYVIKLPQ